MSLSFQNVTLMISDAVDQVGLDDTRHGKRVGYMAAQCFTYLSFSHFTQDDLYIAGMLHDIGVSSSQEHELLVTEMDWNHAQDHCQLGFERLMSLNFYQKYAPAIAYHHTKWKDLALHTELSDDERLLSNLIFLVDRVDALLFQHLHSHPSDEPLHARPGIQSAIQQMDGFFSPDAVSAFLQASTTEAFWFQLNDNHLDRHIHSRRFQREVQLPDSAIESVASILAATIDAKSPFTAEHSQRVGYVAEALAKDYGLSEHRGWELRIAGFLHDIGKLHIPDYILEKEGPLTEKETLAMRRHGFEARDILEQFGPFREIAIWACQHHEFLDGSGYPYQLTARELSMESRILTISDIFQALAQKRPYRDSMKPEAVFGILKRLASENKIDTEVLNLLERDSEHYWQLATGDS